MLTPEQIAEFEARAEVDDRLELGHLWTTGTDPITGEMYHSLLCFRVTHKLGGQWELIGPDGIEGYGCNHFALSLAAEHLLREATAPLHKPRWISVDEKVPDTCANVAIITSIGEPTIAWYYTERRTWMGTSGRITHWMPLPESPMDQESMIPSTKNLYPCTTNKPFSQMYTTLYTKNPSEKIN